MAPPVRCLFSTAWPGAVSRSGLAELEAGDRRYLSDHEITTAETALRALKWAFSEERKALALPTALLEIMKMNDEELLERYRQLLETLKLED